jgi:hypothetical protein
VARSRREGRTRWKMKEEEACGEKNDLTLAEKRRSRFTGQACMGFLEAGETEH